jgi:hypothetical protein
MLNHMGKFWYKIHLKPRVGNVSDGVMLILVLLQVSIKYKFLVVMKSKEIGLKWNHNSLIHKSVSE